MEKWSLFSPWTLAHECDPGTAATVLGPAGSKADVMVGRDKAWKGPVSPRTSRSWSWPPGRPLSRHSLLTRRLLGLVSAPGRSGDAKPQTTACLT